MENTERLISALYLARSDNREEMLSDLIMTVLYDSQEFVEIDGIIDLIENLFHLSPIKYELKLSLEQLLKNDQILQRDSGFKLTDESKSQIHNFIIKSRDSSKKRFIEFDVIINDIDEKIEEQEKQTLWNVFNEYLLECFMTFGRRAIDIFLPYKNDKLPDDNTLLNNACKKVDSDHLASVLKRLVIDYPEKLSAVELRYLNTLALRSEKFYSLGIAKQEYDKINNLKIRNLTVLADTNILYSILDLHIHHEKEAINEIVRLAAQNVIDFRIVYLPGTYKELLKAKLSLENAISRERLTNKQIQAMIKSGKLDEVALQYYEKKLLDNDFPHPADKIQYASDLLKKHGVLLYNQKFNRLEDDEDYINNQIKNYYEFQGYVNKLNEEKNIDFRLHKDDYKITHDIFLRESVKILKEKFSKDVIKFVCLTIDRSLIHFDQYRIKKENKRNGGVINPNFLIPSIFLKKIRPFIPIISSDYRKAFIASLTSPSLNRIDDFQKNESILVQKSMKYFKNLGIEDEEVICGIIKRELFLEEFSQHEQNETAEDFIKTEVTREIEKLQTAYYNLEKNIVIQKREAEKDLEQTEKEVETIRAAKEKVLEESKSKIDQLIQKIQEKEEIEKHLKKLNIEKEKFSTEERIKSKKILIDEIEQSIRTLENAKKPLDIEIAKKSKAYFYKLTSLPIGYVLIMIFLINKYSWDNMEMFTYLFSIILIIASYIYLAKTGENFNPFLHLRNKKEKICRDIYTKFNFDDDVLENQKNRREKLQNELDKLTNSG